MVVRLDLERDRPAVADRDRARVLARAHQHPRALGGQAPQQLARVLVGAVLGPQQARTSPARRRSARGPSSSTIRSYSESVSPSSRCLGVETVIRACRGRASRNAVSLLCMSSLTAPSRASRSAWRCVLIERCVPERRSPARPSPSACSPRSPWPRARSALPARLRPCSLRRRPRGTASGGPDREAPAGPRAGGDVARARQAAGDPGRRPAAGQRRGPGLDHVPRSWTAVHRPQLRHQPADHRPDRPRRRPDATAASIPLSQTTTKLCKQRRPNRNHHCTLTIPNVETPIVDPATLPCVPGACFVNLIVGAYNKHARRGDRRRPRRRPSRRLGRPGQGQAQPRPSARRRPGSDGQFECDAGQRRRCR